MSVRRRPVERLRPAAPAGPVGQVRRALALTRRELTCLGVGGGAAVASWSLMLVWC